MANAKKNSKAKATKAKAATASANNSGKFHFVNFLQEQLVAIAEVSRDGSVKIKRSDLKAKLEQAFEEGAKRAASGERVRFPVIGTLVRKDVPARNSKKGVNPFTGEPMTIKARKETKKTSLVIP